MSTAKKLETPAPQEKPTEAKVLNLKDDPKKPIAERLKAFEELQKMKQRRDLITGALEDLNSFILTDSGSASVTMIDSNASRFNISHPLVIRDMVRSAIAKLEKELSDLDSSFII